MRLLAQAAAMLRGWLRPDALDAEVVEELRFHLDRQVQANVDAGMSPSDARRAAHLLLGSVEVIREESRASRPGALIRQIGRDVAFGIRLFLRAPGFSFMTTLVVALGIGATTAIFSVVYGVMLRPLPYPEPDRLVALWTRLPDTTQRVRANPADYRDWRRDNGVFDDIGLAGGIQNFNLSGSGEPERVLAARMSSNIFPVLGVAPAIGRTFTDEEDESMQHRVVVLGDGLWRRRFGADPSVVGRTIDLSGVPYQVVGVMRPEFRYPGPEHQLWIPLSINPAVLSRQIRTYDHLAVARLKRGVPVEQAQRAMDVIARRLEAEYPSTNRSVRVEVLPLLEESIHAVRPTLYLLLAAVSCLLLIACLNLATLLGTRATSRARELRVRMALGASRGRLTLQALAEVVPILVIGGAVGVAGARAAIAVFVPIAPARLPRADGIDINGPVLAVSVGLLLLTGLVGGLLPAMQAWRARLVLTPRGHRSSTAARRHVAARSLLVVAQLALTFPLLVVSTSLVRSFAALMEIDPGFRTDDLLSMHLAISRSAYKTDQEVAAFCGRIVERVAALPHVVSAGMVNRLPLSGNNQVMSVAFETVDSGPLALQSRTVTRDYFRTMGIPVNAGRSFADSDTASSPLVGVIDDRLARTLWPGESAIGKRYRVTLPGQQATVGQIIGVVGHVRHTGLETDTDRQIYFHHPQFTDGRMVLVVRGRDRVASLTPAVVQAIRSVDPNQPAYDVRTMTDVVGRSEAERWLNVGLVTGFAVSALLLASVGLYGVIAYGVTQRVLEFGIRLALGATRSEIARLVLWKGCSLVAAGGALGIGGAIALILAAQSLFSGVRPLDPISFLSATTVLGIVSLVAGYLPARRAARTEPSTALRAE